MAEDILNISLDSQDKLFKFIEAAYTTRDEGWQLRNRLEEADRAYMREADRTDEQTKAKLANQMGDKTKLQNMTVPMVMEDVETGVSFLTNVFNIDYPMFKFVSDPDKQDIALQWNSLVGEDQIYFGWAGEFNIAFRNGAKYNFAPIEVDWCERRKYKPVNGTGENGVKLEQTVWAGNKLRALDPYNLIYDPRVAVHKVHEKGEFAGYVESMSRIELKMFLASLGEARLKNDRKAFECGDGPITYYVPQINPLVWTRTGNNWDQGNFNWVRWAMGTAQDHIKYKNMYTVTTMYARLMPYDFGIRAPKDQTPDIWKLISVGDVMVYAQPMINAHDYLPIIITQPLVDNLSHQTKSQAENQIPFQDMVSALWNARLQSARRRVTDRMLYNPLLVDPDHINSPNPSAKIPLRPTAYGRKLEEAIYQIPFQDDNAQYFIQEANGIAQWAMRAQGRNNVSMGQFQKGNKLQDEFNQVMANAGARDRTQALMWESFGMQPIKEILKNNYLQMTPKGIRYNRMEEKVVNIDPVELRKVAAEFQVGDGLLPVQKLARTEVMQNGMNAIASNPAIGAGYELAPMFTYLMKVQGVDKLGRFEKAPEQIQYEKALAAWQNATQMWITCLGKVKDQTGAVFTPDDIKAAIGPMPTIDQFQQQAAPGQPAKSGQPKQPVAQQNPSYANS